MSPRMLTRKELELVRDTNGCVLGVRDSDGSVIWEEDVVYTALMLLDEVEN